MRKILFYSLALIAIDAMAQTSKDQQADLAVSSQFADSKLSITFKVLPAKDMVINTEAPWKLEIKKAEGLSFVKTTIGRAELDEKVPGYVLSTSAAPTASQGQIEYSAVVFVCDKDKTRCYREVKTGTHAWQKSAR